MSYFDIGYEVGDLLRLDIHINDEILPAMASIVPREKARYVGNAICEALKEIIPREQFKVQQHFIRTC